MNFEQAYKEYSNSIKRVCFYFEKNTEKANELNQEIWSKVWKYFDTFNEDSSLKTWIYKIAHNTAITHAKKESSQLSTISLEDLEVKDNLNQEEFRDLLSFLDHIIFQLKPLDRELIILYLEGSSQNEIQQITGLSPSNISTKVSRIKTIIQKGLILGGING